MCIIVIKPAGVSLPTLETLETCFWNNPHGAGFMYAKGGRVHIQKGYMDFFDFLDGIRGIEKHMTTVIHFRYATSGGISPEHCHPFPLSQTTRMLRKTHVVSDAGACHNGIIRIERRRNESDTMAFVRKILANELIRHNLDDDIARQIITSYLGGKLAILTANGTVKLFGKYWYKDKGVIYSNQSYL